MKPVANARRLVDPRYATARSTVALPLPLEVDLAPQLLVIALAQTALAASHRALESAHPILGTTPRQTSFPAVTDCEHFAILVMHAASQLAEPFSEYSAAVIQENIDSDDDSPF